jgi:hypothetical protein
MGDSYEMETAQSFFKQGVKRILIFETSKLQHLMEYLSRLFSSNENDLSLLAQSLY